MTDRTRTLLVVLDRDHRVDDAEEIVKAIQMIRGVSLVKVGPVNDVDGYVARQVVKRELREKLWKALEDDE